MTVLVTGGAGFIGANFIARWLSASDEPVVNVDKLTYAGNRNALDRLTTNPRHYFVQADIVDGAAISGLLDRFCPRAIIHFAAESHVDRSITGPADFINTNVVGTFTLLECSRRYFAALPAKRAAQFRFLHVSTDEVYGELADGDAPADETHRYAPNSPYSASKAASDHLVRAYNQTYGLPVLTTHCSNNYGPLQFPEKLIPVVIANAIAGLRIPVYGTGSNIRDWLHVDDHCTALCAVLDRGTVGETYNIGSNNEVTNIDLVRTICTILDNMVPDPAVGSRQSLISFVTDRLGHDRRYALDATKLRDRLGWVPARPFEQGLKQTVAWYLDNRDWLNFKVPAELSEAAPQQGTTA